MVVIYFVFIALCSLFSPGTGECNNKGLNSCWKTYPDTYRCNNIIPDVVPENVNTVILECLRSKRVIENGNFTGSGWSGLRNLYIEDFIQSSDLTFKTECFSRLTNLTEFHMWRKDQVPHVIFEPNMFGGLKNIKTLDFYGLQISHEAILEIFPSSEDLRKVEDLLISGKGVTQGVVMPLDTQLFNVLKLRPIRNLELSYMDVSLDLTAFGEFATTSPMEFLNLSHTILHNVMPKPVKNVSNVLKDLKTIDASGIVMPLLSMYCKATMIVSDINDAQMGIDNGYATFSRSDTLYLNDFCSEGQFDNYLEFRNITKISLVANFTWDLKNVFFDNNNLNVRIFDVEILCTKPSLEVFSYANNQLEYVSPKTFACIHTLKDLNLSGNKLYKMNNQTPDMFKNLFLGLYKLENVSLSNNKLESIPNGMFRNNTYLKRLDFSKNVFEQVHFEISPLPHLELLDLSMNKISHLDEVSRNILDNIIDTSNKSDTIQVNLAGNPFSCRKCSDLESGKWMLGHKASLKDFNKTTCLNEHHQNVTFRYKLIKDLEAICNRPVLIREITIIGSVTFVAVTASLILVIILVRRRRRAKRREDKIRLIQDGQDENEFVLFLSYSSEDCDIVKENVITPISEHLKQYVNCDRELISFGDLHFRPGQYIHNEAVECLNRSSIALFVLSDNFIKSVHCMTEFEQAFEMKKPVILVTLGHVDTEMMSPAMKELYNTKTRVIFAEEANGFALQTSWRNVCESIIDMIE